MTWFVIAVGGALGSVARYAIGLAFSHERAQLPYATLAINVAGSCLLGFLARWFVGVDASPAMRLGLMVGVCGGFTTFSAFSLEAMQLIESGALVRAGLCAALSVVICVAATFAGVAIARAALAAAAGTAH